MVAYDSFPKGIVGTNEKLICMFTFENTSKDSYSYFPLTFYYFFHVRQISPFSSVSIFFFVWQVDYFVDCHYSLPDDRIWLIGGTSSGTLGYFPVRNDPAGAIGPAEAILEGGHTGVVRTVYRAAGTHGSLGQNRGIFGWTGGEDGRLCCWRSDEIAEANKSWISSSLVSKLQKKIKSRHQPY
jgi:hypothetical protein